MARTYQLQASAVINKARTIINDSNKFSTGFRSDDAEMIGWLNDALNLLLSIKPGLFAKTMQYTTANGYLQLIELPRAVEFIEVVGVLEADRTTLEQFFPAWRLAANGAPINWMRVPGEPLRFDTYPPANGTPLTIRYIESPAPLMAVTDLIPVSENYESMLAEYIAGKEEMKDDEHVNSGRASQLMQRFVEQAKGVN